MVTFTFPQLEKALEIQENTIQVIVVENPKCMRLFIEELEKKIKAEESTIFLAKDYEEISFNKNVEVIYNPILLDINSKKIINKIIAILKSNTYEGQQYERTYALQGVLAQYLDELIYTVDIPLIYDEILVENILKGVNIRLDVEEEECAARICYYMDAYAKYLGIKYFVFFHLKDYVDSEELKKIYKHCNYQKYYLILCESNESDKISGEIITILDKDLCAIY